MMTTRHILLSFVACMAVTLAPVQRCYAAERPGIDQTGPALDQVPSPISLHAGLPEPAAWPVRRYREPLRIMVIGPEANSAAPFRRIGQRLRASVEFRFISTGGDELYHVHDDWIEPKGPPTRKDLVGRGLREAIDAVEHPLFDVVVVQGDPSGVLDRAAAQEKMVNFVRAGGTLVVCGAVYPKDGSRLGQIWPAHAVGSPRWMQQGAKLRRGAWLSGVPVEFLAGHAYMPAALPTPGSLALAQGESGAVFQRKEGSGSILFVPTGPFSRLPDAIIRLGRLYDHDEIWLRFWDQLLYEAAHGASAFPAYADMLPGRRVAWADSDYSLEGRIVNRAALSPLAVSVHVISPSGQVVYKHTANLDVPAGSERHYTVRVPVAPHWGSGLYPVYLTVGDRREKRQFHQALEFIPVRGRLTLSLKPNKRGFKLGEEAVLTLAASSERPWQGDLCFGVYDFRGSLLGTGLQKVGLTTEPHSFTFRYKLADHGVRVDTFWAEVVARKDGREWGRAEARFYKYERWSMRNEYQYSTWARMACAPPSLVPQAMRLMAHAGMNSLGYPGSSELFYPAERWGWRYYNERIGMNTFSPVIEYENDEEMDKALRKEAARSLSPDLTSAAFVIGSVGEEAGFKVGWGKRYYWNTPIAPEKACRAFRWYLKERYRDVGQLNGAWKTNYQDWEEVKLTREFSAKGPGLDADGWAHPRQSPLGQGVAKVSLAPFADTAAFYNWYYDRIVGCARRIFRQRINPVTLVISSAPTIGSDDYDARTCSPGGWNDSQWHSARDGAEPGFALAWGHFDWSVKTENVFWDLLIERSGHNDFWVDIPLMFNNDLTHTRASFALRRWTHRLAGHERIILDSRPTVPEVGLLAPNGLGEDVTPSNMAASLQVALAQGGFGLAALNPRNLKPYKIVFAIGRRAVSQEEAQRLQGFVAGGGTLVFTPRFASQTPLGASEPIRPGSGLGQKWCIHVTAQARTVPHYYASPELLFPLGGVRDGLQGYNAVGLKIYRENVKQQGWTTLSEYEDHTPALLTRQLGHGRLVFLNAVYQSHHYIQWVTPTGPARQGFYRLIESLCLQAGVTRTLRLDGDLNQALHVAVKQFTDPTGEIHYVVLRTNGEVSWIRTRLNWLGPQTAGYDVLGGEIGKPAPRVHTQQDLLFRPGAGKLLAYVKRPVQQLRLQAQREHVQAGQSLALTVAILDAAGKPVPGCFPLELRVQTGGRELQSLKRSVSVRSGGKMTLNTALSDPAGEWTLTLTDGITGRSASETVWIEAPPCLAQAPGFIPLGWPSELGEDTQLSETDFIARLRALSELYRRDHSADGWMTKQRLGYYYSFFSGTRHDLLRPLNDVSWPAYRNALRLALMKGGVFVLTGEDVGIHPGSGLSTYPHHDGQQLRALLDVLRDGRWTLATQDGDTVAIKLGEGKLILCRESVDAAGYDNPAVARWQRRWLAELRRQAAEQPIPPPDLDKLVRWWTGQEALTDQPRVVTWLQGNHRAAKLKLDGSRPLGEVFTFAVPPTGKIKDVAFTMHLTRKGRVHFAAGCDEHLSGDWTESGTSGDTPASNFKWADALNRALAQYCYRDDNGWRLIPVRLTAPSKMEIVIDSVKVQLQGHE